jgi:hypothetical protein
MAVNQQIHKIDAQKQQEELGLRKKRRIIESPTQSPLPKSPENTPEKIIPSTIMSNCMT